MKNEFPNELPENEIDPDFFALRMRYFEVMRGLFYPDPQTYDMVDFLASILRIVGMEDGGWDPYVESRSMIEDLDHLTRIDLPAKQYPDENDSKWRFGLLLYSHAVEMDVVYEVIANLLRYHLGEGYSPNPFFKFLTPKRQKSYRSQGLTPSEKIAVIKALGTRHGKPIGELFEEFYNNKLRNPIAHSDFILRGTEFRCRGGTGGVKAYKMSLDDVGQIILKTRAFYSAFFGLENACRIHFGQHYANKAIPYDLHYKGMIEFLVNKEKMLSGFKIHWPNGSDSIYERSDEGIEMTNMFLGENLKIEMMVGLYPRVAGSWSLLLSEGDEPRYTPLADGTIPVWPADL